MNFLSMHKTRTGLKALGRMWCLLPILFSSPLYACPVWDLDCPIPPDGGEIQRLEERVDELENQQREEPAGIRNVTIRDAYGNLQHCIYIEVLNELDCL